MEEKKTQGGVGLGKRREQIISEAIQKGLPIDEVDVDGCGDPLRYALVLCDLELVTQILSSGNRLDINRRGHDDLTPLHLALTSSALMDEDDACKIVKLLVSNGAYTEARTKDVSWKGGSGGDAPGGGAGVKAGIVQLYEAGGRTALHLAALRGSCKLVETLLDCGAEHLVWDNEGETPFSLFKFKLGSAKLGVDQKKILSRLGEQVYFTETDPSKLLRAKNNRRNQRITRATTRQAQQTRLETTAIIRREFQWNGVNVMDEKEVFSPEFLRAWKIDCEKPPEERSEVRKLLYQPAEGVEGLRVWAFTMLSEKYCVRLMEALKRFETYKKERGLNIRRAGSRYGALFNHVGFQQFFDTLVQKYLTTLAEIVYPVECKEFKQQHSFLVSYEPGKEIRQNTHADDSTLTVNYCLGTRKEDGERGWDGGELYFYWERKSEMCGSGGCGKAGKDIPPLRPDEPGKDGKLPQPQPLWTYPHKIGHGIFHLGRQYHGAYPLTAGRRINLIMWGRREGREGRL